MDASPQPEQPDSFDEPTVVIPRITTRELANQWRAELQRRGLVAQDGAK